MKTPIKHPDRFEKSFFELAEKVNGTLMALKEDASPEALAINSSMEIQGFLKTTSKDFEHTLSLLKKAGVTKSFNVAY